MSTIEIYCDGSCAHLTKENWMGMGVYMIRRAPHSNTKVTSTGAITGPKGTHNEAEYLAIMAALEALMSILDDYNAQSVTIHSDSQLIINQINGVYAVNSPRLKHFHKEVNYLCQEIVLEHRIIPSFVWVPRTHPQQKIADTLSNIANPYYEKYNESESVPLSAALDTNRYLRLHRLLEWGAE